MAITPITVNGQMDFHYTVDGVNHVMQLRCELTSPSSGTGEIKCASGSVITAQAAVDRLALKLGPCFQADVTSFDPAIIQWYNAGIYIPVTSVVPATAPATNPGWTPAQQSTFTFRDNAYDLMKLVLIDCIGSGVGHYAYPALGTAFKALVDDIVNISDGHIGAWFKPRNGGAVVKNFLFHTASYNRKQRRIRGLV